MTNAREGAVMQEPPLYRFEDDGSTEYVIGRSSSSNLPAYIFIGLLSSILVGLFIYFVWCDRNLPSNQHKSSPNSEPSVKKVMFTYNKQVIGKLNIVRFADSREKTGGVALRCATDRAHLLLLDATLSNDITKAELANTDNPTITEIIFTVTNNKLERDGFICFQNQDELYDYILAHQ